MAVEIVEYDDQAHRSRVIGLWSDVFAYPTSHNEPSLVIDRKLAVSDGLFFVALVENRVVGTVLAGYDGHRGWIYSLAVQPELRRQRIGSALLASAEQKLAALGCVKINLQIAEGNECIEPFYVTHGYTVEKRISMGKRLLK